jgi:hypothetical protein
MSGREDVLFGCEGMLAKVWRRRDLRLRGGDVHRGGCLLCWAGRWEEMVLHSRL